MQLKQQLAAAVYLLIHRYYFSHTHKYTQTYLSAYILYMYKHVQCTRARTYCTTTSTANVHTLMWKEEKLKKKRANEMTLVHMVGELESEVYTCTRTHIHTCTHTRTYTHMYTLECKIIESTTKQEIRLRRTPRRCQKRYCRTQETTEGCSVRELRVRRTACQ